MERVATLARAGEIDYYFKFFFINFPQFFLKIHNSKKKIYLNYLQIVKPVCSGKLVWCSITQLCEKKCQTKLEALGKLDAQHSCGVKNNEEFCSNEETCGEKTEMLK